MTIGLLYGKAAAAKLAMGFLSPEKGSCGRSHRATIEGMAGNSFGELFRVTTAGVSHGPGYVVIVDGCPPGLPLSVEDLLPDLRRRRPGQSHLVTQRKEEDVPEIWSGVFEGVTDGTSIGIVFRNADQRSGDYEN